MSEIDVECRVSVSFPNDKFPHEWAEKILNGSARHLAVAVMDTSPVWRDEERELLSMIEHPSYKIEDVRYSDEFVHVVFSIGWQLPVEVS